MMSRGFPTLIEASMGFGTPQPPVPGVDEREVLLGYIRWQREQVVATANGLTEDQLRWTPGDALLPILGIINHLAHMEWRWIERRFGDADFPARTDEFSVGTDVSGSDVLRAYWEQAQRTDRIVRAAESLDLLCLGDEHGRGPAHLLLGFDRPIDLRWLLLHVLEETAHHAGHADATRELLDGTKMRG